ncbi:MTOR-associated protein MEAK7 [Daktulosphaira vitifoliae]|uniref:MTOR-associated protein MEAK7 n=1 Tax=Daktulosphaira vitifoliae TaxID=58002 RepID=UPI0021AA5772|nr:MTOR-associated protein MEAK7 [Daktulosphaira vitifoliae]
MGGKGSKTTKLIPLNKEECDAINNLMCYKESILIDELLNRWKQYLTDNMVHHIKHIFTSNKQSKTQIVQIYRYLAMNEVYQENYRNLILQILSKSNFQQYIADLIESILLCINSTNEYIAWTQIHTKTNALPLLSIYFSNIALAGDIENWLQTEQYFGLMHRILITTLYNVPMNNSLLPNVNINKKFKQSFHTILDFGWIMFINKNLSHDCQRNWRLLFSSSYHGESFQSLTTAIIDQGSTIIIVKDTSGHVFGGFASQPWLLKPKFYGDSSCFLFSLYPNLNYCAASGNNEHFMYMNSGQHTLPNGIGMGGQMSYWGLWLDSEYGKGQCSVSCSTFSNYLMPAKSKDFMIDSLEVWCVKEKSRNESDEEERILPNNRDNWDMKLLEMAGRTKYSDGYREDENK